MTVEFEPVRLGAGRRRIDPVAVAAVVVVIAIGVSVVKPWGGGSVPDEGVTPHVQPVVPSGAPPTPDIPIPRVISAGAGSSPGWDEIRPIIRRHETWGVRAIVADAASSGNNGGRSFSERWFRFPSGGTAMSTAFVDSGDQSIVGLGVTFPPSQTPLDVRIWKETGGGLAWVDTEPFDPEPSGGGFLYGRPATFGNAKRVWTPGTYRMDVLVDGSVRRLGISIPDRFSNVPADTERPNLHDVRPRPGGAEAGEPSLLDMPFGLFAIADGNAFPLPVDEGPALDEVGAWLNVDPGTRRAPRSFVAEASLPDATVLGVAMESRVVVMSSSIARLAPEPLPAVVPQIDAPRDSAFTSAVMFRAPIGDAWSPGVYRITVAWADSDGLHEASWHLDLRPGPLRTPGQLLAASRAWARYAGDSGIVRGTTEPLVGGPASATIRLERTPQRDGAGYPARDQLACDGFQVDGPAGTFGVAQPVDAAPATLTARILFEYSRSGEQPILTASGNVPGLTLVALDGNPPPTSQAHRSRVGDDLDSTWSPLCVEVR